MAGAICQAIHKVSTLFLQMKEVIIFPSDEFSLKSDNIAENIFQLIQSETTIKDISFTIAVFLSGIGQDISDVPMLSSAYEK